MGMSTLCKALALIANKMDALADRIDGWADQSRTGGWSTHQVDANRDAANQARRAAAEARAAITKAREAK